MRKIVRVFVFLAFGVAPQLHSQSLPTSLPGLDLTGISAFYRVSRLSGASGWQASPTAPCPQGSTGLPMCGWGFELVYELTGNEKQPAAKPWLDAELAVGYDFLNVHATTRGGANYEMFGSIQTLPSISLYISHDFSRRQAGYLGVGTGFVVLRNVRAYDGSGKVYAIAGDTWGLTPCVGYIYSISEEKPNQLGLSAFIEGSYEVRNFTSLAYTLPAGQTALPSALPRGLYGSGFALNVGLEMKLHKKAKPAG